MDADCRTSYVHSRVGSTIATSASAPSESVPLGSRKMRQGSAVSRAIAWGSVRTPPSTSVVIVRPKAVSNPMIPLAA